MWTLLIGKITRRVLIKRIKHCLHRLFWCKLLQELESKHQKAQLRLTVHHFQTLFHSHSHKTFNGFCLQRDHSRSPYFSEWLHIKFGNRVTNGKSDSSCCYVVCHIPWKFPLRSLPASVWSCVNGNVLVNFGVRLVNWSGRFKMWWCSLIHVHWAHQFSTWSPCFAAEIKILKEVIITMIIIKHNKPIHCLF